MNPFESTRSSAPTDDSLTVFNIQRYSLHDGGGIRTVVFLKGCPLHCAWCSNPESQRAEAEIMYVESRCIGADACGACIAECASKAIRRASGKVAIDANLCIGCQKCAAVCPSKAIAAMGERMTVNAIMDIVERDAVFYKHGGITISGGEPLSAGEPLLSLLTEAKRRRISAAIETCGYGDYKLLHAAARLSDAILYDIKSMNSKLHEEYTGKPNALILSNLEKLAKDFPNLKITVRTPVIAGFNDNSEDLAAIANYASSLGLSHELLPGHRLGDWKYNALVRP
jgi:pyruvate formate lyase activating enzyme